MLRNIVSDVKLIICGILEYLHVIILAGGRLENKKLVLVILASDQWLFCPDSNFQIFHFRQTNIYSQEGWRNII